MIRPFTKGHTKNTLKKPYHSTCPPAILASTPFSIEISSSIFTRKNVFNWYMLPLSIIVDIKPPLCRRNQPSFFETCFKTYMKLGDV